MKILLVDDHKLVRAGLVLVLKQMEDGVDLIEAGTGREAVDAFKANGDLDLVLMDLDLPDGSGLEALSAIHAENATLPVVILSAMEDQTMVARAMELGARGFIPKSASGEVMVNSLRLVLSAVSECGIDGADAVTPAPWGDLTPRQCRDEAGPKLVLSGGVCLPPGYGETGRGDGGGELPTLTHRQLEVLRLMAQGNSNKEIARELDISENTVRVHISAIISALDATNRTEAAYSAQRLGLIPRANLAL